MNDAKSENKQPNPERRFSQEQYDMLMRCSEKNDLSDWNQWRQDHPDRDARHAPARNSAK